MRRAFARFPSIRIAVERVTAFHAHLELTEISLKISRMTANWGVVRAREQSRYRIWYRHSQCNRGIPHWRARSRHRGARNFAVHPVCKVWQRWL